MEARRVGGILALVVGVALVAVGAVGLLGSGPGGSTATPSPTAGQAAASVAPSPSASVTPSPSPSPSPTATPTPSPDAVARSRAFYAVLIPAIRTNEVDTLVARLHPAAIERYGEAACRAYFGGLKDPAFDVAVHGVHAPATWDYATDGRTTAIADAWEIEADLTSQGTTGARLLHVALVDGEIRWFTDCGTPLASPAP